MKHLINSLVIFFVYCPLAPAKWPHDCVCRVSCMPFGGSGTLVGVNKDGRGLVLSAWHVVSDGNQNAITCTFPSLKKRCRGRIIGVDREYDVVALDIEDAPNIPTPRIRAATKEDKWFVCVGYPANGNGRQRWTRGEYVGYPINGEAKSMLHTRQEVISGYSGGARFSRYGEYCGVVSGMKGASPNGMDLTWGVSGEVLTRFVGRYIKDVK